MVAPLPFLKQFVINANPVNISIVNRTYIKSFKEIVICGLNARRMNTERAVRNPIDHERRPRVEVYLKSISGQLKKHPPS